MVNGEGFCSKHLIIWEEIGQKYLLLHMFLPSELMNGCQTFEADFFLIFWQLQFILLNIMPTAIKLIPCEWIKINFPRIDQWISIGFNHQVIIPNIKHRILNVSAQKLHLLVILKVCAQIYCHINIASDPPLSSHLKACFLNYVKLVPVLKEYFIILL